MKTKGLSNNGLFSGNIDKLEQPDKNTVVVYLKAPNSRFHRSIETLPMQGWFLLIGRFQMSNDRMLKNLASVVLGSSKSSTYRLRSSEGGRAGGVFPYAKIHSEGERPHEVRSVPPPVSNRLRPCWTNFLSIQQECYLIGPHGQTLEVLACRNRCSASS